jgi:hypothetical protein
LNTVANAVLSAAKTAQPAAAEAEADAQAEGDATKTNVRISALDVTQFTSLAHARVAHVLTVIAFAVRN